MPFPHFFNKSIFIPPLTSAHGTNLVLDSVLNLWVFDHQENRPVEKGGGGFRTRHQDVQQRRAQALSAHGTEEGAPRLAAGSMLHVGLDVVIRLL